MGPRVTVKRSYKSSEWGGKHTSQGVTFESQRSLQSPWILYFPTGSLHLQMSFYTLFVTSLCTLVLPLLLIAAAVKLWEMYVISGCDPTCRGALPPGTMGLPLLGETLQMVLQVNWWRNLLLRLASIKTQNRQELQIFHHTFETNDEAYILLHCRNTQ